MLFHLAYQPLTLDDLEGHHDVTKFKKNLRLGGDYVYGYLELI